MNKNTMKEISHHIKDIIIIFILLVISLLLWALFLRVESLKQEIPNQVHALVENTIRDTMRAEFIRQEELGNVFVNNL